MAGPFIRSCGDAIGTLNMWTRTVGTVSVAADEFNTGDRSIKVTTPAGLRSYAAMEKFAGYSGGRVSVFFKSKFSPIGLSTRHGIIRTENITGAETFLFEAGLTDENKAYVRVGADEAIGTTVIRPISWHRICLVWKGIDVNTNEIRVYLDGQLEATVTNHTVPGTGDTDVIVGFVTSTAAVSEMWIDDVYHDLSDSLIDPGPIHVTAKTPNTNSLNQFDTAIGNNPSNRWENVNERPISTSNGWQHLDTTLVQETCGVQGQADGLDNLTGLTVVARTAWVWASEGAGGGGSNEAIMNDGTAVGISLTTTPALYENMVINNVYPSTVGLRSSGGARDVNLYEMGMLVAYAGAEGSDPLAVGDGMTSDLVAMGEL